jgi:tripartite-type tricarboxylate transporter receptor subunit TctC
MGGGLRSAPPALRTVVVVIALVASQCAVAQDYPVRPIRLIVPSAPGGASDIIARIVAPRIGEAMGKQVVVDNRSGASNLIGVSLVAKSAPDGYTIGITPASLAINPSIFAKMPYDTLRDLAPVSRLLEAPSTLVVHPSVPATSVKELIAAAKARPGRLIVASSGMGTIPHLAHELLRITAGIDMPQVVFKGTGEGMISVISGELSAFYASPIAVVPLINAGKLRALGVSTKKRSSALPDVPSISETLPGYEATQWFGIFAPARTPRTIVQRLHQELARALLDPGLKARLVADGFEVIAGTPDEFARDLKSDMDKWSKVIRTAGIKPEG